VIAIIWLYFLGRVLEVAVEPSEAVLVGLAAWLAYAGDRWLDTFKLKTQRMLAPHHEFALRRRKTLGCFWLAGALIAAWISTHSLSAIAFKSGICLFSIVAVYYLLTYLWPERSRTLVPRELMVAILFSAGSSLFVLVHHPFPPSLAAACWFALLCFLNCLGVACWEEKRDRWQGQISLATRWPRVVFYFPGITLTVAVLASAMIYFGPFGSLLPIKAVTAASAILLTLLHYADDFLSLDVRLVLADLSLLTPLSFLLVR